MHCTADNRELWADAVTIIGSRSVRTLSAQPSRSAEPFCLRLSAQPSSSAQQQQQPQPTPGAVITFVTPCWCCFLSVLIKSRGIIPSSWRVLLGLTYKRADAADSHRLEGQAIILLAQLFPDSASLASNIRAPACGTAQLHAKTQPTCS